MVNCISEGSVLYQHVLWHKCKDITAIFKSHMIKIHTCNDDYIRACIHDNILAVTARITRCV